MPGYLLLLLTALLSVASNQNKPAADSWALFRPMVGSWEGTSHGQPGEGKSERTYEFVLRGTFLRITSKAVYPPQKENPKGEVHEDIGYISYDKNRKSFVLRQFHVEGFVNQYVFDPLKAEGGTITFVSEAIENIPAGWRAREDYRMSGKDELIERFELAEPGKEFELYSESRFRRIKR